ncbi:MAG: HIT domain-containing protein [Candidatus ainarchaeum sp.]|nr:HIT domain-containing protein [Candidatus ainarchaeum sp.]MDD3084572.1 HIT domain-containing protein [Candidatus ainarchaeum sp.]MDD4221296.1 HIT domain-containing protein [Candidatus ainarchaeum sp.]MDD4662770.1 HIT domain-containing protein [Candidatus ainarchaeum sp.]
MIIMLVENKNILYAPGRQKYIEASKKKESKNLKKCVFCKSEKDLLILESKTCFICANKYPYGTGHLLIIPKRHVNSITDLTTKERIEIFNSIDLCVYALDIYLKPDGFNIGASIGDIAGQSISHLHFHILPRFQGDVGWNVLLNFKVLSVSPKDVVLEIKKTITKFKLKKKFGLV